MRKVFLLSTMVFLTACQGEDDKAAVDEQTEKQPIAQSETAQSSTEQADSTPKNLTKAEPKSLMSATEKHTGTIVFKTMEGGFYAFENDKGTQLTLVGLKPEHMRHGMVVEIQGQRMKDMLTTTQFGTPFQLTSIKIIDDSEANPAVRPSDL